ncbi:MAG: TolC family protein [Polyangiaceae bacterium]
MRTARSSGQVRFLVSFFTTALAFAPNAFAQAVTPAPATNSGATSGSNTGAAPGSTAQSVPTHAPTPVNSPRNGGARGAGPTGQPTPTSIPQQTAGADPGVVAGPTTANGEANPPTPLDSELLRVSENGLTADQVGKRAAETSWQAKANEEALHSAAARVDAAWANFLPRLSGKASYTRLSSFTPPNLGTLLAAVDDKGNPLPAGAVGHATGAGAPINATNPNTGTTLINVPLTFPLVLDNWSLVASLTVPLSDYLFRINQNYTAATNSREAARLDVATARAKSAADGKVAFYSWLRARGAVTVAEQALGDQQTHLKDANNQFAVGNASKADVLRAETAVASAELQVVQAKNLADLTEKQIRVAMHAKDTETLAPGESLAGIPDSVQGNPSSLESEALSQRLEVKSVDANAAAAREQAKVARAGYYPVVGAFADATYANPNPRIFPATATWFPTWDLGVQATWSPNDILTAGANGADAESRAQQLEASKGSVRDSIQIEVLQAWQKVQEADVALSSTKRELASATEAYRVSRELFNNGRATSTTLTDSETELTRARLDALNASVDARVARVQLDHALGRDTKYATQQAQ